MALGTYSSQTPNPTISGFATSLAIIVSCVVSVFLWGFVISAQFALGTALVLGAVYMYSLPKPAQKLLPA